MNSSIINAVFVSDIHAGCKLGLCPESITLDEGGTYHASAAQNSVREIWDYAWDTWVPMATRGEPYVVIFNGDAIDGSHHNSTHQITHNLTKQVDIAYEMLAPRREKADLWYHIKGTEAHVGQSGADEEALACRLGAEINDVGQYARYELDVMIGDALVHATHHIGSTSSTSLETNALSKELGGMFSEAGRWGYRPPDVVVRGHRHRHSLISLPTGNGTAICVTLPGWQLKTPFCYKGQFRITTPHFGLVALRVESQPVCQSYIKGIERPSPVIPVQK